MISLKNIVVISNFESRILWRNWFFKIFTLLVLFFGIIFNVSVFSTANNQDWWFRSISAGIPNANMVFLNMFQSAIVIFLAAGIIKNNKKLDTNEVFFVRPLSNADLVLGKAAALLKLFLLLNLLALTIAIIVNTTIPDTGINFMAYVVFPAITSIPSIVFSTGLTFMIVAIVRNQALSIILMLGLLGIVLIYFQDSYNYILDFPAVRLPIYYSDMAGFANLDQIIQHRLIYVLLGIGFIFGAIFFMNRLPQKRYFKLVNGVIALLFLGFSAVLILDYVEKDNGRQALREKIIETNGQFINKENISIISNDIHLEHMDDVISCVVNLKATNEHEQPLQEFFFSLNPGLKIKNVTVDNQEIDFDRLAHMAVMKNVKPLKPADTIAISITYQGKIEEIHAYLSFPYGEINTSISDFFYSIKKRFSYLQPDYVLLTNEINWYPQTKVGYNTINPIGGLDNFIDFSLSVKTRTDLLAISQGDLKKDESGVYHFNPENLLPKISLAIGPYKSFETEVDSIQYQLFYHKDNDYFSSYFTELSDTLSIIIRDLKNSYEVEHNMKYKFKRLQLVEVPFHFYAYTHLNEHHQAYVQPATVFLPEKGGRISELDFKEQFRIAKRQAKRNNEVLNDKDYQVNILKTFVKSKLTKQTKERPRWWWDEERAQISNYGLFPNLYDFSFGVNSAKWPLLQKGLAVYLSKDVVAPNAFRRNRRGISFEEECNRLMSKKSLVEILTEEESSAKIAKVIQLKGEYLFNYLEYKIGVDAFKTFLNESMKHNQHEAFSYAQFRAGLLEKFAIDVEPIIKSIYEETVQPAFVVSGLQEYQVVEGNKNRYQIIFDVENVSAIEGLVKVSFSYKNENSNNRFDNNDEEKFAKLTAVRPQEKKQIRLLLDEKPNRLLVNTMISKNIPSIISLQMGQFSLNKNAKPKVGEITIERDEPQFAQEIIVDNEDSTFTTFSPDNEAYLRRWIAEKNKDKQPDYYGIWRGSRSKWRPTTGSSFFGKYIRSAHFTRSGNGDKFAIWTPNIQSEGYYDVYIHMDGESNNNDRNNNNSKLNYYYKIYHDDGEEEVTFDLTKAKRGWNFVGTFYFSNGNGKVTQSDKSEKWVVYADAVKWVKQ